MVAYAWTLRTTESYKVYRDINQRDDMMGGIWYLYSNGFSKNYRVAAVGNS